MAQQLKHFWQTIECEIRLGNFDCFFLPYPFQISQPLHFQHSLFDSSFPVQYFPYPARAGRSDVPSAGDSWARQTRLDSRTGQMLHWPGLTGTHLTISWEHPAAYSSFATKRCTKSVFRGCGRRVKVCTPCTHIYSISPRASPATFPMCITCPQGAPKHASLHVWGKSGG